MDGNTRGMASASATDFPWIKICGITNREDAELAISLGASAIGLIFAPSVREVPVERARELVRQVRGRVEVVGVFKEIRSVRAIHEAVGLDRAQIHVPGDPGVHLPILRALRPQGLQHAANVPANEWILIDGSEGRGLTFDWTLATTLSRSFVLAGGLNPENVKEACRVARPKGVDVTSGVELAPGRKDPDKVARFISAVKSLPRPA
ncbi:MAG TPA: phosphoribosylanthranilate isomerase [Lacunisphaera sp.]